MVSFETDFASRSATTGLGSMPFAKFITIVVRLPRIVESPFKSPFTRSPQVKTPILFSRMTADLPIPYKTDIGCEASHASASAEPMTKKPSGLSRSDAIFARDLVLLRPIETEIPMSRLISCCRRCNASAGVARCSFCVPARSRKASSIESGCTSGVSESIFSRTCCPIST